MSRNDASHINLQGLGSITPELIKLLHQASRQTHIWTLETILALICRYSDQFKNHLSLLQGEVTKFISHKDIQRSAYAIQVSS